jgi:hypothetical protein
MGKWFALEFRRSGGRTRGGRWVFDEVNLTKLQDYRERKG